MKPSDRIQQLAQPLIDQALNDARGHISALEGRPVTDEEWRDFYSSPEFGQEVAQLKSNALVAALLLFLDERSAEAELHS